MFFQLDDSLFLKPKQVSAILNNSITSPPTSKSIQLLNKPKPNEKFIYFCQSVNDDLFKADGYRWRDVGSKKSNYGIKTNYYHIATPPESESSSRKASQSSNFRKTVYSYTKNGFGIGRPVLIWYCGDIGAVQSFSHGNSNNTNSYLPTLPSALKNIKENAFMKSGVTTTYMAMINSHGISDSQSHFKI